MEFGLFDDEDYGEFASVGLVDISQIFAMQEKLFNGTMPFDRI